MSSIYFYATVSDSCFFVCRSFIDHPEYGHSMSSIILQNILVDRSGLSRLSFLRMIHSIVVGCNSRMASVYFLYCSLSHSYKSRYRLKKKKKTKTLLAVLCSHIFSCLVMSAFYFHRCLTTNWFCIANFWPVKICSILFIFLIWDGQVLQF